MTQCDISSLNHDNPKIFLITPKRGRTRILVLPLDELIVALRMDGKTTILPFLGLSEDIIKFLKDITKIFRIS